MPGSDGLGQLPTVIGTTFYGVDDDMEEEIVFQDGEPEDNGQPESTRHLHFKNGLIHNFIGSPPNININTLRGGIGDPYNEPLTVDPYRGGDSKTCRELCKENDRLAKKHCDVIRKRVAQWMKDSGCPSSVRGFKKKAKCGSRVRAVKTKFKKIR